ncbi:sugar transferase [Paenibacillus oleatilyticus]|uniref:sugar transferase n=1 Tax=Paenibacillus oleatilyticus TaxID=2594886 RepID=UPI001C1FC90F|nr:sugar transferase [Paenibacillus oleatilyticus]MBU7320064.1 sugar transferase [Paenibacillus oleatilyticus]
MDSATYQDSMEDDITKSSDVYVKYVKTAIDLILSIALILLLLPVLIMVAILIKLESEGPVVFKQHRIGKGGKPFVIYKFRSMYTHVAREGRSPENDQDPRITKVGRFIRKTSLDELPQLFNILKGDMSFIGPRPEQKSIVEQYYTDTENGRFSIKPGITGLWQISEDRKKPIHENLHHDLYYIKRASFWLDIKIIFGTLRVMIKSNTH